MLFSEDVESQLDVVDDGIIMVHRLKALEHLLLKCCNDLPSAGSRFSDETRDGRDGSEMMCLLDELLAHLIIEYESRTAMHDNMCTLKKGKPINAFKDESLQAF